MVEPVGAMTRLFFAVCIALAFAAPIAHAHPSVGIVIASDGAVFYSDLEHVWRVTRGGEKRIAVPNVHTHELSIDSSGAIFGEDSRWLGGDRYRHRIWKRAADGTITDVVPWRDGFWREYGFTRDASGAMYWVTCTGSGAARICSIRKRNSAGRTENVLKRGPLGPVNWIAASPAGEVYIVDGVHLRRIDRQGNIATVARIGETLMGITLDRAGNVYVAAFADRAVVRIEPSGKTSVVARSAAPWAPSGVAVSGSEMWILEWFGSRSRVRRVR